MATQYDNTENDSGQETPYAETLHGRLYGYGAELESLAIVAQIAGNQIDDKESVCTLDLLNRECERLSHCVGEVACELSPSYTEVRAAKLLNGFNSEVRPFSRKAMILDLCRGIQKSVQPFIDSGEVSEDIGVKLVGVEKAAGTIECLLAEASDDAATAVDVAFDRFQIEAEKMTPLEVAQRLREHCWEAAETLSATPEEDGYTVRKTFTRKGLRYFVAEREFLQSLLPEE
jgi:hypothetical protein